MPDQLDVQIVEAEHAPATTDPDGALRHALRKPIGSSPLRQRVRSSDTIAIIVNDITRPTPYRFILPILLEEIDHVPDEHVTIFVATGTHRSTSTDELRAMLGDGVVDRFRIVQNDAEDRSSHLKAGVTSSSNAVWIHRRVLECDLRILTGFIEPHFFAGFSGGPKACVPGMALLSTILRNHCPANIDHPKATWGITRGNPIWEEINEAARMASPSFLLNVTMNRDKALTGVFAGDVERAHASGCELARRTSMVEVKKPCEIVITSNSGYPLDLNLYQAVKGMSAAARIVAKGGTIILAADCWDGIPDHGQYKRLLSQADDPSALLEKIRALEVATQDTWQAQIHALVCAKASVHLFSDNLTDDEIRNAMLIPCHDVAAAVHSAVEDHGPEATVAIMSEGPQTIPFLSGGL